MAEKIYSAISSVMEEVGTIGKDKQNKSQGFMYRGVDDVMNALNPALIKHRVFMVPEVLDQIREERTSIKGTNLIYSVCKVRYRVYADDGSYIEATVIGEGMDSGDKATNKALAIAFKYACFQLFCIPTEEMNDPDEESHELSNNKAHPCMIQTAHINTLYMELQRTGVGIKGMLAKYNVADVHNLTIDQYKDAIEKLKSKPDKPVEPMNPPPDETDQALPWNTPKG